MTTHIQFMTMVVVVSGLVFTLNTSLGQDATELSADQVKPKVFTDRETKHIDDLLQFVRLMKHPKVWLIWKYDLGVELELTEHQALALSEIKQRPIAMIQMEDLRAKYGDNPYGLGRSEFKAYMSELDEIASKELKGSESRVEEILTAKQLRRLEQISLQYSLLIRKKVDAVLARVEGTLTKQQLETLKSDLASNRREFRAFQSRLLQLRRFDAITAVLGQSAERGLGEPLNFHGKRSDPSPLEEAYRQFSVSTSTKRNSGNVRRRR